MADDYLVTEVLRKSPNLPTSYDREATAVSAFYEAEKRCEQANERLLEGNHPEWWFAFTQRIADILGPVQDALACIESGFKHGSGATTSVKGFGSVASMKYDAKIQCTPELEPFVKALMGPIWHEACGYLVEVTQGNRFTTVPKNAKTDRGICVEATLNVYIQLAIGAYLKSRLKLFGIDLWDQSRNQELARVAITMALATVDMTQASDSLAAALPMTAFPFDWFHLLDICRSKFTDMPNGETVSLEKFSSMGNGFTFEVETIVFYSLALAIVPKREWSSISVYGDDVILPTQYLADYRCALDYLGFKVNEKKSFGKGLFFESCGSDWFNGQNVRPFYLKGNKEEDIEPDLKPCPYPVRTANKLRHYASRIAGGYWCDDRFKDLWQELRDMSPKDWRKPVPASYGDVGLIVGAKEAPDKRPNGQLEGYTVTYINVPPLKLKRQRGTVGAYFVWLDGHEEKDPLSLDPLQAKILRLMTGAVRASNKPLHKSMWDLYFRHIRASDPQLEHWTRRAPRKTFGLEPRRGMYGKYRPRRSIIPRWDDGYDWGA